MSIWWVRVREERGVGGVGEAGVEECFETASGTGEVFYVADVGLEGHGVSLAVMLGRLWRRTR